MKINQHDTAITCCCESVVFNVNVFVQFAQRYGSIYALYIGRQPAVVLTGQKMIREALITQAVEFAGRSENMMVSHVTKSKGNTHTQNSRVLKQPTYYSHNTDKWLYPDCFVCLGVIMADYGDSWREHRRFALTTLRNFGLGKRSMEQRILEEVKYICAHLEESAGIFSLLTWHLQSLHWYNIFI